MWIYIQIQRIFRKTNTAIARIESITRSPIYADFSEILGGLSTIRAYKEQNTFILKLETAVNTNTIPKMLQSQAGFWLIIRLDIMGAMITFFVAALAVASDTFLDRYIPDSFISPGYIALALNYSFVLTVGLKFLIRTAGQLEAQMNSVERIKFYSENIDQENASGSVAPKPTWPEEGKVSGRGVQMRYRDGPLVLKGIDFAIDAGEKIGIAGRTG